MLSYTIFSTKSPFQTGYLRCFAEDNLETMDIMEIMNVFLPNFFQPEFLDMLQFNTWFSYIIFFRWKIHCFLIVLAFCFAMITIWSNFSNQMFQIDFQKKWYLFIST